MYAVDAFPCCSTMSILWSLRFPSHSSLHLTGEFNGWNRTSHPFVGKGFGRSIRFHLTPYLHLIVPKQEKIKLEFNRLMFHEGSWELSRLMQLNETRTQVISGGASHCQEWKENLPYLTWERLIKFVCQIFPNISAQYSSSVLWESAHVFNIAGQNIGEWGREDFSLGKLCAPTSSGKSGKTVHFVCESNFWTFEGIWQLFVCELNFWNFEGIWRYSLCSTYVVASSRCKAQAFPP